MRLFDKHASALTSRARLALAASPGVLASMLALQPQAVRAQAFQGTPEVVLGNASRTVTAGAETITINSPQVTLNWSPTDVGPGPNPVDFLPQGNVATFQGGAALGGGSYTVLNRIIAHPILAADPSRIIQLSGTVNSDAAGSIWFYSPTGMLISGTASFNVGSLLLTASEADGGNQLATPFLNGNQARFRNTTGGFPNIEIASGASFAFSTTGGYLVAIAPGSIFDDAGFITSNPRLALPNAEDVLVEFSPEFVSFVYDPDAPPPPPPGVFSFQGTPDVILGSIDRSEFGQTEFIDVNATQTTINWTPIDDGSSGTINFLPSDRTVEFRSGSSINGSSYTVLNRIIAANPSAVIGLSGTVNSDADGSIWFYAPGGLLLTNTANFNVGSLLLTANDPVGAAGGQPFITNGNQFRLQADSGSTARVEIESGAGINASNHNSYVIAVAPGFRMDGNINVNGSAALVAAEDVSFTLNGGLFDITTNISSAAGGMSSVSGNITGPGGNSAILDYHRIYMMAMPRNDAMTMLITGSGQIGFDIASAADVDGNAVVLSGGYDIQGSAAGKGLGHFANQPAATSTATATVDVDAATFTSNLVVRSKNVAQAIARTGQLDIARDIEVYADGQAFIGARNNQLLEVSGNVLADASVQFNETAGANRTAGQADVAAIDGGIVGVLGTITARADARGDSTTAAGQAGGIGTGGFAQIRSADGFLQGQSLLASANGAGGIAADGAGGSGVGGLAMVQIGSAGNLLLTDGSLVILAQGIAEQGADGQSSGSATGGSALLEVQSGANLVVPNRLEVNADALYLMGTPTNHLGGGVLQAGDARAFVGDGATVNANELLISAIAFGPDGTGGNEFRGGIAELIVTDAAANTSVNIGSGTIIDAGGYGANGLTGGNVQGGNGIGGNAFLIASGNPSISLGVDIVGLSGVRADATGGSGAPGGDGGNALGGSAQVRLANGGGLQVPGGLIISADTIGGDGVSGGTATAFGVTQANSAVSLYYGPDGMSADGGIEVFGDLRLSATAIGGNGSSDIGGAALGGFIDLRLESQSTNVGFLTVDSSAVGGGGSIGGAAQSGRAFVDITDSELFVSSQFQMLANATGGSALADSGGAGGNATVGQARATISGAESGPGGRLLIGGGDLIISAIAQGGAGGSSTTGNGGAGGAAGNDSAGANVQLVALGGNGSIDAFTATISNNAIGGAGGDSTGGAGGSGGNATGGYTDLGVFSGPATPLSNLSFARFGGTILLNGSAQGGNGGAGNGPGPAGRGGDAIGGKQFIPVQGASFEAVDVNVNLTATGGNGGGGAQNDAGGGNAQGGEGALLATSHATGGQPANVQVSGLFNITAPGNGGASNTAPGSGQGGLSQIRVEEAGLPVSNHGDLLFPGGIFMSANGFGGSSLSLATTGGDGFGGTVRMLANRGTLESTGFLSMFADGFAGPQIAGQQAGSSTGGLSEIVVNGGSATIGSAHLVATGYYGTATGGTIRTAVESLGGTLTISGSFVALWADGLGGVGQSTPGSGTATGGTVDISTAAGGTTIIENIGPGTLQISAQGDVSSGMIGDSSDAIGGQIIISNAGTTSITDNVGELQLQTFARAGNGGTSLAGGSASGGSLAITNTAGTLDFGAISGTIRLGTNNFGGNSNLAPGSSTGGTTSITASGGTIGFSGVTVIDGLVRGGTGFGVVPGNATGGTTTISLTGGNIGVGGNLEVNHFVDGQIARNGNANLIVTAGQLDVAGNFTLFNDVSLFGFRPDAQGFGGSFNVDTAVGSTVTINGAFEAFLDANDFGDGANRTTTGGTAMINSGGTFTVTGSTRISASAGFPDGGGGVATGGNILISANSGTFTQNGLFLSTGAFAGSVGSADGPGAAAGDIVVQTLPGAQFTVNGPVSLLANAVGGGTFNFDVSGFTGGLGRGGEIAIINGGAMLFNVGDNLVSIRATGMGGDSNIGINGLGVGGDISILTGALGSFELQSTFGDALVLDAVGVGGLAPLTGQPPGNGFGSPEGPLPGFAGGPLDGPEFEGGSRLPAGDAIGGTVIISNAGNFTLPGGLNILVNASGGIEGTTGNVTGGIAEVGTSGGVTTINGDLVMNGNANLQLNSPNGNGTGGTLSLLADGGTLNIAGGVNMAAIGAGLEARGGDLFLRAAGALNVDGNVNLTAAIVSATNATGALSLSGTIDMQVPLGGELTITGSLLADVSALVQVPLADHDARAGNFGLSSSGAISVGGSGIDINANAAYLDPDGQGGNAFGGSVLLNLNGGTLDTPGLRVDASAQADRFNDDVGGMASGGTALFQVGAGATASVAGRLELNTSAVGGNGITGGAATGGNSRFEVAGIAQVDLDLNSIVLNASGTGGAAFDGTGGAGTGGSVTLMSIGAASDLAITSSSTGEIFLNAAGTGGGSMSGAGGSGFGGSVTVANGGSLVLPGSLDLNASGLGGAGVTLGNGAGGSALLDVSNGTLAAASGNVGLAATGAGSGASGGIARIVLTGGLLQVGGAAEVDAGATGLGVGTYNIAAGLAEVTQADTSQLQVTGDLNILARASLNSGDDNGLGSIIGGTARFDAHGTVQIMGSSELSALAFADGNGGTAQGGTASLTVSGTYGSQAIILNSDGFGGDNFMGAGRAGTGGTAAFSLLGGADSTIISNVQIFARGDGGAGEVRGDGTGGTARIDASGQGTSLVAGEIILDATGAGRSAAGGVAEIRFSPDANNEGGSISSQGGVALRAGSVAGDGTAVGGTARVMNQRGVLMVGNALELAAGASGASGGSGGNTIAGTAEVTVAGGEITVTGTTLFNVNAFAGNGIEGAGGLARAGTVRLLVNTLGEAELGSFAGNTMNVSAIALAGAGGRGGAGGDSFGGTIQILTGATGNLMMGGLGVSADSFGGIGGLGDNDISGPGGVGGSATGSMIALGIASSAGPGQGVFTAGDISVFARVGAGRGGDGAAIGAGGAGGNAQGSSIELRNDGGLLTAAAILANAVTTGGRGGIGGSEPALANGGNATGGDILIQSRPNAANGTPGTMTLASLTAQASSESGLGGVTSGNATGGSVTLRALRQDTRPGDTDTGSITISGALTLDGTGQSGGVFGGGISTDGGSATGGTITLSSELGQIAVNDLSSLFADGLVADSNFGGDAQGGTIDLRASGGLLDLNGSTFATVAGFGGVSFDGDGGSGIGGFINIGADGGGVFEAAAGLSLFATGAGGDGGTGVGGIGAGGSILAEATGAASNVILGATTMQVTGTGGDGGDGDLQNGFGANGGNGFGGTIDILAVGGNIAIAPTLTGSRALIIAGGGFGGFGGAGFFAGNGGDGTGATVRIGAQVAGVLETGGQLVDTGGQGGAGRIGGDGFGGQISLLASGADSLLVALQTDLIATASGGNGEIGGRAAAATVVISASQAGATVDLGDLFIDADARGGNGGVQPPFSLAAAGDAIGGNVQLQAAGSLLIRGNAQIDAASIGGSWIDPSIGDAGNADGGTVRIAAEQAGGILRIDGSLTVSAPVFGGNVDALAAGQGGNAAGTRLELGVAASAELNFAGGASFDLLTSAGSGGNNAGGTAIGSQVAATINGNLDIGGTGLAIAAQTLGGSAVSISGASFASGGNATGAQVDFSILDGGLTVSGNTNIVAAAVGGDGQSGAGGNATAGHVRFLAVGGDTAGPLTLSPLGTVVIEADARGGLGGNVGPGGDGGTAVGGVIELGSASNAGVVALGALTASANGIGGRGGDGTSFIAGGDGFGGTIRIGMGDSEPAIVAGNFSLASAVLGARGEGGSAGSGAGVHGLGNGGSLELVINGAVGTVAGPLTMIANGFAGGFSGEPGEPARGIGGFITVGSIGLPGGPGANLQIAGAVTAQATGSGSDAAASLSDVGIIQIRSNGGSALTMASVDATTFGTFSAFASRSGLVADPGSTITIAGNGQFLSGGSLALNDGGIITVGGTLLFDAVGPLVSGFETPTPGAVGIVQALNLDLTSGSTITLATQTTNSEDVKIIAGATSALTLGDINSTRDINVAGGTVIIDSLRADRDAVVSAATELVISGASSGGALTLLSLGALTVGPLDAGVINPAVGVQTDILVDAVGALNVGAINGAGNVNVTGSNAVTIASLTAGGSQIATSGALVISGAFVTTGATELSVGSASLGSLSAGSAVVVSSGLFAVGGNLVTTGSSQLTVGSAQLGNAMAGGDFILASADAQFASISAGNDLDIQVTAGSVAGSGLSAGRNFTIAASGGIDLGDVTAGSAAPGNIVLSSGAMLNAGSLTATGGDITLDAADSIMIGAARADGRLLAL
ncbi:beta strand repeat-containing protein, partial [Sandarakinorhabdus sp.]|uniref:beta strand repeat-containing protein n=1 Tax=Sandarakinorhabdus sp. TaxID=1916663 RepID=UPI003F7189DD